MKCITANPSAEALPVLDKLVAILQEIRQEQRETRQEVANLAKRE